ncbi:MAG: YifB family Mg chelatase-like AAA ATPase [Planctomycetota bacterium]
MLASVHSFILTGIDASPCTVEVDLDETDFWKATVVGLPDAAVRESIERVRTAVLNAGFRFPEGRLLVNLAPADIRKEGPVYDLPIAVGLLMSTQTARAPAIGVDPSRYLFAGELALDGSLRPVKGVIAAADLASRRGLEGIIVPAQNAPEAAVVPNIQVIGISTLSEVVALLNAELDPSPEPLVDIAQEVRMASADVDFAEVRGQEAVKRGLTVAAAGSHNVLMLGPAGTGKTMMARALPGILPPMSPDEAVEVTRIYSAVGRLAGPSSAGPGLVTNRPVRAPHHTASSTAIIGGGIIPKPGEISLAHRGILFLDELPEFPRAVLDTLRQPLEEGTVTIARAHSAARFPADFMLVAAMNPTARGDMPTDVAGRRAMDRYLSRVSRPLLDRIDVHLEAPAIPWQELSRGRVGTSTSEMRALVAEARRLQQERQGATLNSKLTGKQLDDYAPLESRAEGLLGEAIASLGLSARAFDKIRRVARTIADLRGSEAIDESAVAEAVQYRLLDRQLV